MKQAPHLKAQRGRPALRIRRHGGGCCSAAPPTLVNKGREARRHRRSVPKDDSHMTVILRCRVLGAWRRRGPQPSASGATALKSSRAAAPRAGVAAAALEQRRLDELLQRREVAAALTSHRPDHRQYLGEEQQQEDMRRRGSGAGSGCVRRRTGVHLVLGLGAALPVLDGRVAPDALLTAETLLLLRSHDTPAQLHV